MLRQFPRHLTYQQPARFSCEISMKFHQMAQGHRSRPARETIVADVDETTQPTFSNELNDNSAVFV